MKSRLARISSLVIAAAMVFYFFQCEPDREKTKVRPTSGHFDQPEAIGDTNRPRVSKTAQLKGPEAAPKLASTPSENANPEDLCWKKLSSEISSQSYFANRGFFSRESIGEWYFSKDEKTHIESAATVEGKFMLALGRAGLLEGKTIQRDDEEALALLDEVVQLDPQNSAPLLYAATIESRRGNGDRAKDLYERAEKSEFFNSYILSISESIFSQVRTPADLVLAIEAWSTLPVPNYLPLREILKQNNGKMFARQMLRSGLDNDVAVSDIEWFPLEYAVGKALLNDLEPNNKFPPLSQIWKRKMENYPDQMIRLMKTDCDLASLEPMVAQLRKRIPKHQR